MVCSLNAGDSAVSWGFNDPLPTVLQALPPDAATTSSCSFNYRNTPVQSRCAAGPAPGGYDHNIVLFSLGPDAKDKVHGGMASDT